MTIAIDEPAGGEEDIRGDAFSGDGGRGDSGPGTASTGLTGLSSSAGGAGSDRCFRDRDERLRTGLPVVSDRDLCFRTGPSPVAERDRWRDEWRRSGAAGLGCDRNEERGSAEIEMGRFPPVGETS